MSKKVKRLFEGFQPKHYQLELSPHRDTKKITGTVIIAGLKVGRPSQRLTFHQLGLKVTSATIVRKDKKGEQTFDVVRINHQDTTNEVRLHCDDLLYGGSYTVRMEFSGTITDAMHGIYPCYYEIDGKKQALIATQFESHHAREAFPCIDEPEAKATFDLTLISPTGETALANTPVKEQTETNGLLKTVFETTPRMSTYLLAFVYGDLQHKETQTKDGASVRAWSTKAHTPAALDFGLDVAKKSIEFFNDYFDVPYPLPKADHVALPDFSSGAMENWGLITYRESALLADPALTSQSSRELITTVIAHETSHQWFGNLVTMRWWDDLWLNESFASVMEFVASDALFPEWNVWNSFITQDGLSALRRDSIAGVQAVKTEVNHPDEISTLFDPSIVYAKGGRLLRMMMLYIGEEAFRKGLKNYFTTHAYGNTTGADLWKALGGASGKDVAAFMDPWLTRSGLPLVRVDQTGQNVTLTQKHFLLDPSKADPTRVWPVPLLSDRTDIPELLESAEASVTLNDDAYVRINQGAIGHYIVQYVQDAHMQAIAAEAASQKLGIAERLMLLSDSSMLARSGEHSFAQTMKLLEHYISEDREPVWDIMALILGDCRRFIDVDLALEPHIKALIRSLIRKQFARLGWNEAPGEDVQDTKLRAIITSLGVYAEDETVLNDAFNLFKQYKSDTSTVPAELRSIVFSAAVRHNIDSAFSYLLNIEEQTSNVELKLDIAAALTYTKDHDNIELLLGRLKDADKVRPQDLMRWVAYLLRNRHAQEQAWQWLRDNWEWIEKTYEGDKSYDSFPRFAANAFGTPQRLEEYAAFFKPMEKNVALTRNIAMGIEELTNRVTWLQRDVAAVRSYLQAFN